VLLSDSIHDEIRELMAEIIEVKPEQINPDDHLVKNLGADSMMALELLAKLEKKYDITIEPENLPKLVTLRSTVELVEQLMQSQSSAS
jgi:acyl carrier protein